MKKVGFVVLSMSAFLAGCADPSANKPKAQTTDVKPSAVNSAPAEAGAAAVKSSAVDSFKPKGTAIPFGPETSKVEFTGSKVTGSHDGGFKQFKGVIDLVNEKPAESTVAVDIDATSVFTEADGLTEHLKTADFFDVAKFPAATFLSTKIEPDTAKGADAYTVTGDMEIHGVKKSVTFPATIKVSADSVDVASEFTINRKDFGITYAGKADDLIRDGVVLKLNIKAQRKK